MNDSIQETTREITLLIANQTMEAKITEKTLVLSWIDIMWLGIVLFLSMGFFLIFCVKINRNTRNSVFV